MENPTKQTKRGGKGKKEVLSKTPIVVRYVIENIDKGVYPSIDTLDDIFDEIDSKHYRDISLSLLNQLQTKPKTVPKVVEERQPQRPQQHSQQKIERPKVDPKKVISPGSNSLNVIGNARKGSPAV